MLVALFGYWYSIRRIPLGTAVVVVVVVVVAERRSDPFEIDPLLAVVWRVLHVAYVRLVGCC